MKIYKFNKFVDTNNESKYSSVAKILRGGIRESIKTIAILTGENPFGKKASDGYNREANERLENILTSSRWGFRKVRGSYGSYENSFIVNNISLDSAIELGVKFDQDSIIFGEVVGGDNKEASMVFKMVSTNRLEKNIGEVIATSNVFVNRQGAEDFYTEIGGKKFIIPFYGVVDRMVGPDGKVYKVEKDYSDTEWSGGLNKPSNTVITFDAQATKEGESKDRELEEELNSLQERALNTFGSTSYHLRGKISKLIREYFQS